MKEVIMLGMGDSLKKLPPDIQGETWGLNRVYQMTKRRLDKLFFFDSVHIFGIDNLNRTGAEIITKDMIPGLEKCTPYPLWEIIDQFKTDYFTCTVAYMIAYAIYTGVERITMYGIDMATDKEYLTAQRPCVEHWVGFARGRGIQIIIHPWSLVCRTQKLYGYENKKVNPEGYMLFVSKYRGCSVNMGEKEIKFQNGRYQTNDAEEIAFLSHSRFAGAIVKADPASYGVQVPNQSKESTGQAEVGAPK